MKGDIMKKVFLTSNIGCSKKINGKRFAIPINNINNIIEQIKDNLSNETNFVFFVSNPEDYEANDIYANVTFESFNMSGFNFRNLIIIDNRYTSDIKETIKTADLVFLAGGNTSTQMQFFEKINLKSILKDYEGIIIGQSAGSINLAKTAICAPEYEEEIGTKYIWPGLNKTNINIEPHFTLEINNELEKKLRNELLDLSQEYLIYAIPDGTHIYDNGKEVIIYGEAYLIKNRAITKISNNTSKLIIK